MCRSVPAHRDATAHGPQSCAGRTLKGCQAQLDPTAESVLLMLLPAV